MDGHADVGEPGLLLRVHADVVGEARGGGSSGEVLERAAESALDLGAHALRAVVVDHELHPRLHARDAVGEVLAPGVEEGAQDLERLLLGDEDAEVARESRHRGEPAAGQHRESLAPLVDDADEGDAVDLGRVAAVAAGRDRDLVLAREVGVVRVAVEERRPPPRATGVASKSSSWATPGDRTAGDVAHGVAARAGRRQPGAVEEREDLGQRRELDPVQLDVLARRELAVAAAEARSRSRRWRGAAPA